MLRKARIADIKQIQALINDFAGQDLMLPRSLNELYDNIRDFWVDEKSGKVIGCAAVHICWDELVEIKSVAVRKESQRRGVGSGLIRSCLKEARELGANKAFVLTYKPEFFKKFGFRRIDHASLPHKVWAECINCPKFPDCNEIALIKSIAK